MSQDNDNFNINLLERLLATDYFSDQYRKGVAAKEPSISFQAGELSYPDHNLRILPKVQELKPGEGFYVIKGYEATRIENEKIPVSQFFTVFKNAGYSVEQADILLRGSALRHVSEIVNKQPVYAYSQIDFKAPKTKNDNFRIVTVPDDHSLIKTLGLMNLVAKQQEKEMILAKLQESQRVQVTVKVGDNFEQLYVAAAARKTGLGIDLMDKQGKLLKVFPQQVFLNMQAVKADSHSQVIPKGVVTMVTAEEKDKNKGTSNKMHA